MRRAPALVWPRTEVDDDADRLAFTNKVAAYVAVVAGNGMPPDFSGSGTDEGLIFAATQFQAFFLAPGG